MYIFGVYYFFVALILYAFIYGADSWAWGDTVVFGSAKFNAIQLQTGPDSDTAIWSEPPCNEVPSSTDTASPEVLSHYGAAASLKDSHASFWYVMSI